MRMAGAGVRADPGLAMDLSVMFMDCPEFADRYGTARCGLPAAVEYRYTVSSLEGLLESVKIRCPRGHWFSGPVEALTWEKHSSVASDASQFQARSPASTWRPGGRPGSGWLG
jgi:hypothetical protein